MASDVIELSMAYRGRAQHLTRLRKPPEFSKEVLKRMAAGRPVSLAAANEALLYAALAACTAGSQSMSRRADAECVQVLWEHINGVITDADRPTFTVDWADPVAVSSWLLED